METPAYVLEFEKPLRELTRQLDELRQRSIETNVDVASEIRAIERPIRLIEPKGAQPFWDLLRHKVELLPS